MIVSAFKNKNFPFYSGNYYEEFKEESESEDEKPEDDDNFEQITELDKFYGSDLINKYFKNNSLREIINKLKDYRKNPKTQNKYHMFMINLVFGLNKLDNDIRNMSEDEVRNKRVDYLKYLVRKIVDVNQELDDMPDLETEEFVAQRQQGQGLKILTPQQMITRLPILLAQLKAGNNSQKLKNEIRQIVYSLYRSKNISKTTYNHLINNI